MTKWHSGKVRKWQCCKYLGSEALLKEVQGKSCPPSYQREADLAPKETKTERIGSSSTEKPDLIQKLRQDSPFASRLKVRLGTALCNCLQLAGLRTRYPADKSKVGQNNFCIMSPKQSFDHSWWLVRSSGIGRKQFFYYRVIRKADISIHLVTSDFLFALSPVLRGMSNIQPSFNLIQIPY